MSTASERLARYVSAEEQILLGQEVQMGSRRLRRSDLAEVRKAIRELQAEVATENRAGKPNIGGLGFSLADLSGDGR